MRLALGSIPAALILLGVMAYVPFDTVKMAQWIRYGLAFALPVSAAAIVLYPILMRGHANADAAVSPPPRVAATVVFGAALGFLVTLTSVGAGAIGVVVLAMLFPLMPAKRIVGSDIAHAVPLTLVAGAGHLGLGHVDFGVLLALLCGSIPGILFGTRLAGVAPDWLLRPLLALTLCYAAYALLYK